VEAWRNYEIWRLKVDIIKATHERGLTFHMVYGDKASGD
jgi:hypothetical protein